MNLMNLLSLNFYLLSFILFLHTEIVHTKFHLIIEMLIFNFYHRLNLLAKSFKILDLIVQLKL